MAMCLGCTTHSGPHWALDISEAYVVPWEKTNEPRPRSARPPALLRSQRIEAAAGKEVRVVTWGFKRLYVEVTGDLAFAVGIGSSQRSRTI